jgi:hypothetical protein
VFLRALDYFTGILFLTTNRVGQFEEAFLSRIHVSLGYEKLDDAAREQIWQNLFDKLGADHERGGPKIVYDYDAKCYAKSKDVQSLEWNGREIRNGKFARDTLRTNTPFTDNHKLSKPPLLSHLRLQTQEKRDTAEDLRTSPQASGVNVSRLPQVHGSCTQWHG